MDFIDKKEKFAELIEKFAEDNSKEKELLDLISEFKLDEDFKGKELFENLFNELTRYLSELSRKELKQRALMIRSFIY